ncbi:MAG: PQQ-binding-like beta-propeller repeat protein [Candidatus Thalassarchaeaceae archaeon]|jgi:outer membrane protein assembly factor BamB|nr:PQQ-binding-like beta-propeller repeat protein [Candidatus Thalassarchaeaceae archaeon]
MDSKHVISESAPPVLLLVVLVSLLFASAQYESPVSSRFVPDISEPTWPPCQSGTDCAESKLCTTSSFDPEPVAEVWNITGENRTFSSPHTADLNADGILDIVIGTGIESPPNGSIVAINGHDGSILWNVETNQEMFSSAQFGDLDGDGEIDVILGGRGQELRAIDGQTGNEIWAFDATSPERNHWYQFYTGQFIEDVDSDGINDWLTANGGDPTKAPTQERGNGYLMVISGSTGKILAIADTPDGMETYMSPVIYNPHPEMATEILFGTGGETWHGGLWSTSLDAIMSGDISGAKQIVPPEEGIEKGLISPPIIVDLTRDEIQDIVVSMFDGRTIAIDGRDYSTIWEVDAKSHAMGGTSQSAETWVTPAAGYFSPDSIPDIFVHYVIGTWPFYDSYWTAQIDGATGTVSWSEETGHTSASSPLAVDLTGDQRDEVVMIRGTAIVNENDSNSLQLTHELLIWNSCDFSNVSLFNREGISIASPLVADLDNDGYLDMISTSTTSYESLAGAWTMHRTNLSVLAPEIITWGAYMGTGYDGRIQGA